VKDWEIGMHGELLVTTPTTGGSVVQQYLIQSSDARRLVGDNTNKGEVVKYCFRDCSALVPLLFRFVPLFAERNAN
jgi:hypothetical protein